MMVYSLTDEDLVRNANLVKDSVIQALAKEGLLASGHGEELAAKYFVIYYRKGVLGRIFDKLFGTGETEQYIKVVKSV